MAISRLSEMRDKNKTGLAYPKKKIYFLLSLKYIQCEFSLKINDIGITEILCLNNIYTIQDTHLFVIFNNPKNIKNKSFLCRN